jgi:peroxiredoxin
MDANEELAKHCEEKSAVFVGIASYGESQEDVQKYCKENDIGYTVVHDGDQKIAKALGAQVVSTTMVLDKEGKLAYHGALLKKDRKTKTFTPCARNAVDELLAGKAVSEPKTLPSG